MCILLFYAFVVSACFKLLFVVVVFFPGGLKFSPWGLKPPRELGGSILLL